MDDESPNPLSLDDIDHYPPPSEQHRDPGYAPCGLGTRKRLNARRMDLQPAVNVLMITPSFTLETPPTRCADALPFSLLPLMKPTGKLQFGVAEQMRDLQVSSCDAGSRSASGNRRQTVPCRPSRQPPARGDLQNRTADCGLGNGPGPHALVRDESGRLTGGPVTSGQTVSPMVKCATQSTGISCHV